MQQGRLILGLKSHQLPPVCGSCAQLGEYPAWDSCAQPLACQERVSQQPVLNGSAAGSAACTEHTVMQATRHLQVADKRAHYRPQRAKLLAICMSVLTCVLGVLKLESRHGGKASSMMEGSTSSELIKEATIQAVRHNYVMRVRMG